LPDKIVKIIPKKEDREELIQKHINKIKHDTSIAKHVIACQDQYQEGDKWKESHNMQLISQLSRKVHEPEELVLHKRILVCMICDKTISNS